MELDAGKLDYRDCFILKENVSKQKHSSRSKHNPDYTAGTFVVTSNSEHYPPKSGDKFCRSLRFPNSSYAQTKENEFILHVSMSDSSKYRAVSIDYAKLENQVLFDAAALGRYGNFKYGVFDNTEERTQEAESQVTGSTSRTTGSETGIVTPIYKSTYGVRFGNERTTTSVDRTPNSITVNRKHFVRFYNSEPDTDGYFNVDLILKTFKADRIAVLDSGIPMCLIVAYLMVSIATREMKSAAILAQTTPISHTANISAAVEGVGRQPALGVAPAPYPPRPSFNNR